MKRYQPYKNIRKGAMIMGLPISLFALQMISVIGSLLVIIFSFSLGAILWVFGLNAKLYVVLSYISKHPVVIHLKKVFPNTISNKKSSGLCYEED